MLAQVDAAYLGVGDDVLRRAFGQHAAFADHRHDQFAARVGQHARSQVAGIGAHIGRQDRLAGAGGADILTGGTGADKFKFVKSTDGRDTITDFSAAQGDKLVFVSANFGGLAATTSLNAANFRANTTGLAGDADDRFIFETDTGILRYDSNGSTAGGAVEIARLTGVSSLSASAIAIVSA